MTVPILCYHSVSDRPSPEAAPFAVTPAALAAHLRHLVDHGFRSLTVSELVAARRGGTALPERPVVLTFDDGFADFHDQALPLLERFGFAATLYVTSGYVRGQGVAGPGPMLSWSQLLACRDRGVEIGAHSHSHPQLDLLGGAAAAREVELPKAVLEQRLEHEVASFAYPHGYASRRVRQAVLAAGYRSACAVRNQPSGPGDDPYLLARLTVRPHTTLETLARALRRPPAPPSRLRSRVLVPGWRAVRRSRALLGQRSRP